MTVTVSVDPTAKISPATVVGAPSPPHRHRQPDAVDEIRIGPRVYIANFCIVHSGVVIHEGSIIEEYVIIDEDVVVGKGSLIRCRTQLEQGVRVSEGSIVGGTNVCIGAGAQIGSHVRCMGNLLPAVRNPALPPEELAGVGEGTPVIEDGAFIGWSANVFGKVTIGSNAFVTAGALITRDVPARHIAFGINQTLPGSSPKARRKFPDIQPGFFEQGCA